MDSYFIRVNRLPGTVRTVLAPITRLVLGFHPWQNNSDFIPDWNWKSKETGEQERRIPLHRPAGYQLGLWILALILCETDIDEIEAETSLGLEYFSICPEDEEYDPECVGWQLVIHQDPIDTTYVPLPWLTLAPDDPMPKILLSAIRIALSQARDRGLVAPSET